MTLVPRPNGWVLLDDDPATTLTYAARVDPAPLTVSVPGRQPTLGSLVVVVTNGTPEPVAVASVGFTIVVGAAGPEGSPLMPTTAGSKSLCSDTVNWSFRGPSATVTSGTSEWELAPGAGTSAELAPGASVSVEIYDFQTVQEPGTAVIEIRERLAGTDESLFVPFAVSTFPDGFFFDGLIASTPSGAGLQPVAQVPNGTPVTLTWNSSLVDTRGQTVFWSTGEGQQRATPDRLGEWTSPPMTADTVFVVEVQASGAGGEPLIAALSIAVSVVNPAIVAGSVTAASLTAAAAGIEAATFQAATFSGTLDATAAQVSVLGAMQPIEANHVYVANSDALVLGSIMPADRGRGYGVLHADTGGFQVMAEGGYRDDGSPVYGSFVLPVASGQGCTVREMDSGPGASFQYVWVALGKAPPGMAAFERVGEAEPVTFEFLDLSGGGSE